MDVQPLIAIYFFYEASMSIWEYCGYDVDADFEKEITQDRSNCRQSDMCKVHAIAVLGDTQLNTLIPLTRWIELIFIATNTVFVFVTIQIFLVTYEYIIFKTVDSSILSKTGI